MIRDIILEYTQVGFICNTLDHFQILLYTCKDEGIIFSKGKFIEEYDNLFEKYSKYANSSITEGLIALLIHDYHGFVINPEENKKQFQIYSRPISHYQIHLNNPKDDFYKDWHKFKMINYTGMIRDNKIDKIL